MNPVIFGGAVGAIGVFLLTIIKDLIRWLWLRRREKIGLLRLVFVEFTHNESDLRTIPTKGVRTLNIDTWQQIRPRLAALLCGERFRELAEYYMNVQTFNDALESQNGAPQDNTARTDHLSQRLVSQGDQMKIWLSKYYVSEDANS